MMPAKLLIISSLLVPVLVRVLIALVNGAPARNEDLVSAPVFFGAMGWVCYGLTVILVVIQLVIGPKTAIWIAVTVTALCAALGLAVTYSLRISYDETGFTVNKFGFKKHYSYCDIDSVRFKASGAYTLRISGRKTMVGSILKGRECFLSFALKRYVKVSACPIPIEEEHLFNGHILNPGSFLFFFLIAPVLTTLLTVVMLAQEPTSQKCPEKLLQLESSFSSAEVSGPTVVLTAPFGKVIMYDIPNKAAVLEAVANGDTLIYQIEPWEEFNGERRSHVWAMESVAGKVYFDVEDSLAAVERNCRRGVLLCASVAVISWLFTTVAFYVMSDPNKHPILIRLFVKPEYIIW